MSSRISSAAAAFALLAGCSSDQPPDPRKPAEGNEHIACAVGGLKDFADVCAVERSVTDGKLALIVRHPDGGFRRFDVLSDGRGVAAADGAETAQVALAGNVLEVSVGGDRYRFPATTADHAAKR